MVPAPPRNVTFYFPRHGDQQPAAALKAAIIHIITSQGDHLPVLNFCTAREKEGYRVTYLPVDREGLLNLADLEAAITALHVR